MTTSRYVAHWISAQREDQEVKLFILRKNKTTCLKQFVPLFFGGRRNDIGEQVSLSVRKIWVGLYDSEPVMGVECVTSMNI
jgi:hypothetical protein